MTPLAAACLDLLSGDCPPVTSESIGKILFVTGASPRGGKLTENEIDAAVDELMAGGKIERVWKRNRAHYRAMNGGSA